LSAAQRENAIHITDAEAATVIYAPGLDPGLEARVHSHVAVCAECSVRLEALRVADRSIGELLSSLDVPAPTASSSAFVRAARAPKRKWFIARQQRAAAAVIAFMVIATAAAAAIPASPLHQLIVRALRGERAVRTIVPPLESRPTAAASSGVSFTQGSSLDVVFERRGAGGSVHLRLVDGDQVSLSSPDGGATYRGDQASLSSPDGGATYRVGSNRITVNQSAPANFQLEIPRSLGELRILIGSEVVFERRPGKQMSGDTLTIHL